VRLHPLVRDFTYQLIKPRERSSFRHTAAVRVKSMAFQYQRLFADIHGRGVEQVIDDLDVASEWWGKRDGSKDLESLRQSLRLSAGPLSDDPDQLPAQLRGRLLGSSRSDIDRLIAAADASTAAWLRPRWAALNPPGSALTQSLSHDSITALAVTKDGRLAVTGAADGSVRVWDLNPAQLITSRTIGTEAVVALTIADDGNMGA